MAMEIYYQAETIRIPACQSGENTSNVSEGALNEVGGGSVKAGMHDGKHASPLYHITHSSLHLRISFFPLHRVLIWRCPR